MSDVAQGQISDRYKYVKLISSACFLFEALEINENEGPRSHVLSSALRSTFGSEMKFIIYLYWICSIVIIITAFGSLGILAGLSAIGTSIIAFCAAAGLKATLYGTPGQMISGVLAALLCMGIAHWLGSGFSVQVYGNELTGTQWGWIGFIICLVFTPRSVVFT